MILIRRKTGKGRVSRVRSIRAFALLLPTLLAWLLPSFANAAIVHEGTFSVTANISGTATVVSAAVSRYSGADTTTPTEGVAGSTSNGQNGACTGGLDDAIQTLSLTSTVDGSVHYVTTHTRNRVLSSEDVDYTPRAYLDNTASGAGGAGSRTPSRGGTMAP